MIGIETGWLEEIGKLQLSERANRLRQEYMDYIPKVASERARLSMESWKETGGEPLDIRRAKLLKKVLEETPVIIFPRQLLVGSETKYFLGGNPYCDYDGSYLTSLLGKERGEITMGGPVQRGMLDENDYASLIEAAGFWKGRTGRDKAQESATSIMGSWYDDLVESGVVRYESVAPIPQCWLFDRVVNEGLRSFIIEARERVQRWTEEHDHDIDKLHFWKAAVISLEAAINLARRYSEHARELATVEKDPKWRAELEEIAETCQWVPENPARTFREALQSVTLVNLALRLESPVGGMNSWGNIDQYMYSYFKCDLDEGRLTLDKAADLIHDLLLNTDRERVVLEASWLDQSQKGHLISVGLGGPDREGEDASNELSYLVLHVMGLAKYSEPHIVIRWHSKTPNWLMRKALETNWKVGGGVPQFQNAEHIVDYLTQRGASLEAARYFHTHGCSQAAPADSLCSMQPSNLNVPICMDLALHNGVASKTGKKIGVETGDPRTFQTFEQLYEAFKKQVDYVIRKNLWHDRLIDRVRSEYYRQPLISTLLPGCLEKGKDHAVGGLNHYGNWFKKDRGLIPAADSLVAIKKLVYEDKMVTMSELLDALDSNFEGKKGEEIRQMCLAAPKYGNDGKEADEMVRDVAKFDATVIQSEKNIFGWPYAINRNGQGWHWMAGRRLAALPNGRKSGEPHADGSLSAMQGMDRNGPTALLSSALTADFKESLAAVLTLKLSAPLVQTEELRDKVVGLTESFLRRGGTYIQYNILDAKVLLDAKRNPDKYRDLVVRVGGYSAYFVNLSPEIQDEIIRRTEHSLAA
ncbi:pyruvate formate lyase family protein [Chloroflexota bacterium]